MWTLSRIALYPVKSLDPVFVEQAEVLPGGGLAWDRQFALFDANGQVINAKKQAPIQQIRASYDLAGQTITVSAPDRDLAAAQFALSENQPGLAAWFSDYFDQRVTLKENRTTGFPDDLEASGPTIISTQTYEEVARWFPGITVDELRLRFRANLSEQKMSQIIQDLVQASIPISQFRELQTDLEDAFVTVSKEDGPVAGAGEE